VEIGDTIDTQEQSDTPPGRSRRKPRAASADTLGGTQRTPRNSSGRARRNGSGNGNGDGPRELTDLLAALRDLRDGDFTVRLGGSEDPLLDDIASAFNGIAERNERLASEAVRVSTTIGREGQMNERASIGRATGGWATITSSADPPSC
jgi:hypothetical protein